MRRRALAILFRLAAGAAAVAFAVGFVMFAESVSGPEPANVPRAEGIVALTGGSDRIADAMELLAAGRAGRLLITGVNQTTTLPEIAERHPKYRSLFDCCIDLGYEALNTAGNALEAERWAGERQIHHSLIVVTSAYHMPRALIEMRRALPEVQLFPYPVVPDRLRSAAWWQDLSAAKLVGREYIKFIFALARSILIDTHPAGDRRLADSTPPGRTTPR